MVGNAPNRREDGEISEAERNKSSSSNPSHPTYSIRDNPLITNPPAGVRPISAKARKVLAWTKKLALREERQKAKDELRQKARDERFRSETREFRRPSRSRPYHPSRRYNDSRPDHRFNSSRSDYHRPRSGTSLTDDENDHENESYDQPTPKTFNDHPSSHRRYHEDRTYAPPDDKSSYPPSDHHHDRQSVYSEPRRSFELDRQSHYPPDRPPEHHPAYHHEPRRSSYPPEASFPPTRPRPPHPPNLVPNYPPSHYHPHPQPSGQPPSIQEQPVYEYDSVNHASFSTQQPSCAPQPSTIPVEYNSHSHQASIPPVEAYYPPQVHHSPPVPQPVNSNEPQNHPPYYIRDSRETHRQSFHPAPEQPIQEPYPAHSPHSQPQPLMAPRFVSNYPVPPVRYESHHSPPQPPTSLHAIETSQTEPYQPAPPHVHPSAPIEYGPNPYESNPAHTHLEKDRLWRPPEEGPRWEHENMRVDPYHQHERTQSFSRVEGGPPLVPLGVSKQSHFYPSHENDERVLHASNPTMIQKSHEQQSQWYPIDDDYLSQKKEAQEIMVRLISWGVTADYLLSIGISESLVRTMYTR